jgi:putative transcriptional regulator
MPRRAATTVGGAGLEALRRSGAVTELLFLYECWTRTVAKLRDVADRLGLTVQAVSHLYRELARRGWVEVRHRQYTLTVAGVAVLHGTLSALGEDIGQRLERLQIVRTTVALARRPLVRGQTVSLELLDGLLTATPGGRTGSRGTARASARAGDLVEVGELEGIVPISPGPVSVYVVPRASASPPAVRRRAAIAVRALHPGLVVAQGLEAFHLARRASPSPVVRFGAAFACLDASRLGVRSVAFVTEEELPRFLGPFAGPSPPPITVARLS